MAAVTCFQLLQSLPAPSVHKNVSSETVLRYSEGAVAGSAIWTPQAKRLTDSVSLSVNLFVWCIAVYGKFQLALSFILFFFSFSLHTWRYDRHTSLLDIVIVPYFYVRESELANDIIQELLRHTEQNIHRYFLTFYIKRIYVRDIAYNHGSACSFVMVNLTTCEKVFGVS